MTIAEIVISEWSDYLRSIGKAPELMQKGLHDFWGSIEPEVGPAIASGDLYNLRDLLTVKSGRTSLGLIYRERQVISAVVIAVVQTATKLGYKIEMNSNEPTITSKS